MAGMIVVKNFPQETALHIEVAAINAAGGRCVASITAARHIAPMLNTPERSMRGLGKLEKPGRSEEFPVPADVFRQRIGVGKTCWRKYKRTGKIKIIELFGRDYLTPEECNRILRDGTG